MNVLETMKADLGRLQLRRFHVGRETSAVVRSDGPVAANGNRQAVPRSEVSAGEGTCRHKRP